MHPIDPEVGQSLYTWHMLMFGIWAAQLGPLHLTAMTCKGSSEISVVTKMITCKHHIF